MKVTYFKYTLTQVVRKNNNHYAESNINFDITELKLELISKVNIKISKTNTNEILYKYKVGLYTIYTFNENFDKIYEDVKYYISSGYDYNPEEFYILHLSYNPELFIDTVEENLELSKELSQNQSLKTLYDNDDLYHKLYY